MSRDYIAERALYDFGVPYDKRPSKGLRAFYKLPPSGTVQAENFEPPGLLSGRRAVWSDEPFEAAQAVGQISLTSGIFANIQYYYCNNSIFTYNFQKKSR